MADSQTLFQELHKKPPAAVLWFEVRTLVYYDEVQSIGQKLFAFQEAHPDLHLVISFRGVQGVSSAMFGKLITLFRRITRTERKLILCELEPAVAEMFTSSRLNDYFNIKDQRQDALTWLSDLDNS